MPRQRRKATIPKALREQVWATYMGQQYENKCLVTWCTNRITVFDFQCGHNIPEVKGGPTTLANLRPICSRCNTSMGSSYTFDEWCNNFGTQCQDAFSRKSSRTWKQFFSQCCCFFSPVSRNENAEAAQGRRQAKKRNKKIKPVEQVCSKSVPGNEKGEQKCDV